MRHLPCLLALLCAALPALRLSAQCPDVCNPLAYEGFAYANNTPLHGQGGGAGWGGSWEVQTANIEVPGYQIAEANPLLFPAFLTVGRYASGGHAYLGVGRKLDVSANGPFAAHLSGGYIAAPGQSLFFAFLLRKSQDNSQPVYANLHEGSVPWYDTYASPRLVGAGYYGAASDSLGLRYWTLRVFGNYFRSPVPIVADSAALLLVGVEFGSNGTNTYRLWVNPPSLGEAMPAPLVTYNSSQNMRLRALKISLGTNLGNGAIDEIRFADSYACAVPDADVPSNLPPVAHISHSANSGMAPLNVQFDASASYDPDGSIVAYRWDFGDGQSDTGAIISHSYDYLGQSTAILSIEDNCGTQVTQPVSITVLDSAGQFPCLAAVRLERMASFGQADGRIVASGPGSGISFKLIWPNGDSLVQSSGTFSNLAAGSGYVLHVSRSTGCSDRFDLHMPTDSSTLAGWSPHDCQLGIGMNLDGVPYWNQLRAFKNLAFEAGAFFTAPASGGAWSSAYTEQMPVDSNGYPLALPFSPSGGGPAQIARSMISASGHLPPGDYVLLYDGSGNIQMQGSVSVQSAAPGRIAFSILSTGNIWYNILQSTAGNHIRNIRIVRPQHEANYETAPFYEPFLDRLNHFEAIRFMDWGQTNNSDLAQWSARKRPGAYAQGAGNGVAYEHMIALANWLQKDIWVCVPHLADENFITQMALLFKNQLDPDLRVYLEYSNEVWNTQFEQSTWVEANRPAHWNHPRAYAERCRKVFEIWHGVFGEEKARVKRVLGTQAVNPWLGEQAMAQLKGDFDYLSPTWYFGYEGGTCVNTLHDSGAAATPQEVIACSRQNFHSQANAIRQQHLNAHLYGKSVVEYEGGQHMTSNPFSVPFQQAVYDAQIHPDIYDLYQEVLDSLRIWGSELAMAFTLASARQAVNGSWGALEFIEQDWTTQPAPKWEALMDNILCYDPPVDVVLPVELMAWRGHCVGPEAWLAWETASETNSARFIVERWADGEWRELASLPAAGQSWSARQYHFNLAQGGGRHYYRLKMLDLDGSAAYSAPLELACDAGLGQGFRVFPNPAPAGTVLRVALEGQLGDRPCELSLRDMLGRELAHWALAGGQALADLPLPILPAGSYVLSLRRADGQWQGSQPLLLVGP